VSAQVVQLHPAKSVGERLWSLAPDIMRKRSSRTETDKEAVRAAKAAGGGDVLVAAFEAFLAGDDDYRRYRMGTNGAGPPGLARWLKWGRWEAWVADLQDRRMPSLPVRPGTGDDNPIRAALVQALGEPFVRSYVDPYELVDGVLIVPEGKLTARAKLLENRESLRVCGVRAMRKD